MPWVQIGRLIAKALGPVLKFAGIYLAGHRAGSQKAAISSMNKAAKLRKVADAKRKKADEIDEEVAASPDADLRQWLRDNADRS